MELSIYVVHAIIKITMYQQYRPVSPNNLISRLFLFDQRNFSKLKFGGIIMHIN